MPETTFYEQTQEDGQTRYVCAVPAAGFPDNICGHWSRDFTLFRQHMEQQHAGILVQGEPPAPSHPETPPPGTPSHPETPRPGTPGHQPSEEPDPEAPAHHPAEEPDPEAPSQLPGQPAALSQQPTPPPSPQPTGA